MTKIKGMPVTLIGKVESGKDGFGKPIYEDFKTIIDNVLVSPTSTEDVTSQLNLTGKMAAYTLAIPKGDTHEWKNQEVEFFGKRWRTIGVPIQGIEAMIPLDWNKKVMVESYE